MPENLDLEVDMYRDGRSSNALADCDSEWKIEERSGSRIVDGSISKRERPRSFCIVARARHEFGVEPNPKVECNNHTSCVRRSVILVQCATMANFPTLCTVDNTSDQVPEEHERGNFLH